MNKIIPENVYYIKDNNTNNKLIKLEIYENQTKLSLVKKYFCKIEKNYYSRIYNYKLNVNNYYYLKLILIDYCCFLELEKPKYYIKVYKKIEKFLFIGFIIGTIIILI